MPAERGSDVYPQEEGGSISDFLQNDNLHKLLEKSHLTQTQLQTALIWQKRRQAGEPISNEDAEVPRGETTVSRGAFYRSLSQAKKNIKRSLATLALASVAGLVEQDDLEDILKQLRTNL